MFDRKMMNKPYQIIVSRSKSIEDYVLEIIEALNHNTEEVEIKGSGWDINKVADIYNSVKEKLKDGVTLDYITIGSETKDRRRISYLLLRIKRAY
ncbi:DNA-binding protein [Acidianus manzaensis]